MVDRPLNDRAPRITVGILSPCPLVQGVFRGGFTCLGTVMEGGFSATLEDGEVVLRDRGGKARARGAQLVCVAVAGGHFELRGVTIGIGFHWEQQEDQSFDGELVLAAAAGGVIAINRVGVEDYLASVISSEMSAEAPREFLQAHAIASRSWLLAMLNRRGRGLSPTAVREPEFSDEQLIRWYDREDHVAFDVCADDHCQRYQGTTKIITPTVAAVIEATRGVVLVYDDEICDARFSKACGGITEPFETTWEATPIPYLTSVSDSAEDFPPLENEDAARRWILARPAAYCHTRDEHLLRQILPAFDRATTDFFRWSMRYERCALEQLLRDKSGRDFGTLRDLVPIERGPSGRIVRLKIVGSERSLVVGKELEIRRWLSESHLYSSAFVVDADRDSQGTPTHFTLRGAGWGHGVGLCQIGAAVMAVRGFSAAEILQHYFRGTRLEKRYENG